MRVDNSNFEAIRVSGNHEPRYVVAVSFDADNTVLHYFSSHSDALLPAGLGASDYTHGVIRSIGGTTQKLNPDEGRSTIGAIGFSLLDVDRAITSLLSSQLGSGYGLRKKRIRVYMGDAALSSWDDYIPISTQVIDSITWNDTRYEFQCADIQRQARKEIFALSTTNIVATVSATATTIPVVSTAGFVAVQHGASYADAPNQTVYYFRLEDEIIRATGKTGTSFTGCTRGVLGTAAARHVFQPGSDLDRQPEVKEFVYLEMPGPKLAYALLTGILDGQTGTLPDTWNLGIATEYVDADSFLNIDPAWYDAASDSGLIFTFMGLEEEDGKRFIERELMLLMGAFVRVNADGQLEMKKMGGVLTDAAYIDELNPTNVDRYGPLKHDMQRVINQIRIKWNWDPIREKYTRGNGYIDLDSHAVHSDAPIKEFSFRGLSGTRFTADSIGQRFDAIRDRFSGPPEIINVTCLPTMNHLEVGDVVRVNLPNVADYAGNVASLDRSMEIQSTSIDWVTGKVTLSLFGSSQKAAPIAYSSGYALPDSFYTSEGTDLASVLTIDTSSGTAVVTVSGTLSGAATTEGAIYYYDGDLIIDEAADITITENVQLRIRGFLQVNGSINGVGQSSASTALGVVQSMGGLYGRATGTIIGNTYSSTKGTTVNGASLSVVELSYDGSTISGVPSDLRGSGGPAGADYNEDSGDSASGGSGGNGGAGLMLICRGYAAGVSGAINLSGTAGSVGSSHDDLVGGFTRRLYAGSGASGYPGAFVIGIDGDTSSLGTIGLSASRPAMPVPTGSDGWERKQSSYSEYYYGKNVSLTLNLFRSDYQGTVSTLDASDSHLRVAYILAEQTPEADRAAYADAPSGIATITYLDLPATSEQLYATVKVTVSAPSDTNYDYANIYRRNASVADAPWTLVGPASPSIEDIVQRDAGDLEYQARSVSVAGEESLTGPSTSVTIAALDRPDDVAGFNAVRTNAGQLRFSWTRVSGNIKHYEIRKGSSWASSILIGTPTAPPADFDLAQGGQFLIRAVNYQDVKSVAAAAVTVLASSNVNVILTHSESDAGWPGSKTDVFADVDGGLRLDGTLTWADLDQPWSSYTTSWGEESQIASEGVYVSSAIDLGSVITARVELDTVIQQIPMGGTWASWDQPWSSYGEGWTWAGPVGIVGATFEVRTSSDGGSTWGDWVEFIPGDYTGDTLQFRVTLNTGNASYNCRLPQLDVKVDVPDRVETWQNVTIPSGGTTLTFAQAFNIVPIVTTATLINGAVGDTYKITNLTETGFDIEVFDSSGTMKSGSMDLGFTGY